MEQTTCSTCFYYRQHYSFDERRIFRVYCGHCVHKRVVHKLPSAKACQDYVYADPAEDAFVSKEYLSKALLTYMEKLDLLPEIYDATGR